MYLYFILEFRSFSAPIARVRYVTLAFTYKWKYEKSAAVIRVLQNVQSLVLLLRCFAEDD